MLGGIVVLVGPQTLLPAEFAGDGVSIERDFDASCRTSTRS